MAAGGLGGPEGRGAGGSVEGGDVGSAWALADKRRDADRPMVVEVERHLRQRTGGDLAGQIQEQRGAQAAVAGQRAVHGQQQEAPSSTKQ